MSGPQIVQPLTQITNMLGLGRPPRQRVLFSQTRNRWRVMSNSPCRALSVSQLSLRASRWPSGLARFHSAQADLVRHFDAQRSLFSVQTETNTHAESCQG